MCVIIHSNDKSGFEKNIALVGEGIACKCDCIFSRGEIGYMDLSRNEQISHLRYLPSRYGDSLRKEIDQNRTFFGIRLDIVLDYSR